MKKTAVSIKPPNIKFFDVTIKGTSPLIFHKWSEKSIQDMIDKRNKSFKSNVREEEDPEVVGERTFYKNKAGEVCIPAIALKKSIVSSARQVDGLAMTMLRGSLFVIGDEDGLIPVKYKNKIIRRDMVKVGMGSSDIRYRGQVSDWKATVSIKFNADVLSADQLINLINIAGFSCGICEWRPEKGGDRPHY